MNGSSGDDGSDHSLADVLNNLAGLCCAPRSVAGVAALLSLPLGVARVLLADMAEIGRVWVHRSAHDSADTPDMALMERVLSGLRRL